MSRSLKIGLALGGGGARGIAHLGVLRVLHRAGIPVDVIAGTSFGALVGAMYAVRPDLQQVQDRIFEFLQSAVFKKVRLEFLKRDHQEGPKAGLISKFKNSLQRGVFYGVSFRRESFITEQQFSEVIGYLIDDIPIEQTQIPIVMNATDLRTGKEYIFDKGSLRKAVCATCALPGILPPVLLGEHLLIDGGWINPIPVELARRWGSDIVIAVNTSESNSFPGELKSGFDLLFRADSVVRSSLAQIVAATADVMIRPDIGAVHWADFSRPATYLQKGVEGTEAKIGEIQDLIRRKRIRKMLLG